MTKVRIPNPLVIFVVKRDIPLMYTRARMPINMTNLRTWVIVTSTTSKDIRHKTARLEP